jgi:hypothetical protein
LLFGETVAGGTVGSVGGGTVYALQPPGSAWSEKVIWNFCPTCTKGQMPQGGLYTDGSGNLWGTTVTGGAGLEGVAFELAHGVNQWTDPWTNTVIYNFCWAGGVCPDGAQANGVTMDTSGNLFGTAAGGDANNDGVLFELTNGSCTEGGTQTFWCNSVKHAFCSLSGCADGAGANGNLAIDSSGNIYGTTRVQGSKAVLSQGGGTVWKSGSTFSVLHKFCQTSGCADGYAPTSGVIIDSSGNLFGGTSTGGTAGVLYENTP